MILEFFRFEMREQLRSPLLWLLAFLFGLMALLAISTDAVLLGGSIGNVHRNSPTVVVQFAAIFTLFGLLISGVFVAAALLRDFEQGTADLIFSNPINKHHYLMGRLSAAYFAILMVYTVVLVFMFAGQFMPWIDPERLGPVSVKPYMWVFLVYVIPNALFSLSILALLAVITRSILGVYIGVLAFLVLYGVSASLLSSLDNVWLATLMEPMGLRAFGRTVRYWTALERNTQLPEMTGYI